MQKVTNEAEVGRQLVLWRARHKGLYTFDNFFMENEWNRPFLCLRQPSFRDRQMLFGKSSCFFEFFIDISIAKHNFPYTLYTDHTNSSWCLTASSNSIACPIGDDVNMGMA